MGRDLQKLAATRKRKRPLEVSLNGEKDDALTVDEDDEPKSPSERLPRRLRDAIEFGSKSATVHATGDSESPTAMQGSKRRRFPRSGDIYIEEVRHVGQNSGLHASGSSPSQLASRQANCALLPLGADEA